MCFCVGDICVIFVCKFLCLCSVSGVIVCVCVVCMCVTGSTCLCECVWFTCVYYILSAIPLGGPPPQG